jgi:hypothetical protein
MFPALVLALLLASPAPPPSPRLKARSHTAVGTVTSAADGRLSLRTPAGATEAWVIPADVKVTKAGRVASLADLVPGAAVVLSCEDEPAGEHRVRAVRISASLPSPAPAR